MKKNYITPVADLEIFATESVMLLNLSGEYDETSNDISWDSLAGSLGL